MNLTFRFLSTLFRRPSTADSASHLSPSIANAASTSIRQSPSTRTTELTPSRLGPNSNPRSGGGSGGGGASLPSFENLSSGLPEDDTKRRRVTYNDQEPDVSVGSGFETRSMKIESSRELKSFSIPLVLTDFSFSSF